MPNPLRVLVNLAHAVKRDSMALSFVFGELKCLWAFLRKRELVDSFKFRAAFF